jgi:hypothetical protein
MKTNKKRFFSLISGGITFCLSAFFLLALFTPEAFARTKMQSGYSGALSENIYTETI